MLHRRHFSYAFNLLACIAVVSALIACGPTQPPEPAQPTPALTPTAAETRSMATNLVRGYLAIAVGKSPKAESSGGLYAREIEAKDIYLPAVSVYLENVQTNKPTDPVRTDLSGRFTIAVPDAADYRVCWKSPLYGDGCLDKSHNFKAGAAPTFLSTVLISLPRKDGFVASYGRVRFIDDSLPRLLEPLSDINAYATVTLIDEQKKVLGEVPVNNFGDYLMPYLPAKDKVQLVASIEKAKSAHDVHPDNYRNSPRIVAYHLTINNTPPVIDGIVPRTSGGKRMQLGSPAAKVVLKASTRDRDGDALKVQWVEGNGSGTLSAKTGNQIEWTLPAVNGRYAVMAIVADGKGGYARRTVRLNVGAAGVAFGGVVAGTDGKLLENAEIEINGKTEKTDVNGRFTSFIPEADRYVFNIRKPGYGFYSRVYDRTVTGGRWTLTTATVAEFDPTQDIVLQDKRSGRNCPGPATSRVNWKESPRLTQVWWQDGKGNNVPPPIWFNDKEQKAGDTAQDGKVDGKSDTKTIVLDDKKPAVAVLNDKVAKPPRGKLAKDDRRVILPWQHQQRIKHGECGLGIAVKIPANGLQTESGDAPVGPVELSLATVDLSTPEQMPGEDAVAASAGGIGWMQSYGAGSIELREKASGKRLNLKPGVEADVSIPVDRSQLMAGAPLAAQVPLLYYNETTGVWKEEHKLTLDAAKQNYVTKVKHFSTLNTDVVFTNPSCLKVESNITGTFDLEVTIPMPNGGAPKVKHMTISDAGPHVIYSLPNGINVTLVAIRNNPAPTPPKVLGVFVVNTGAPQAGGFSPPPPPTACATSVTLGVQTTFPGDQPDSGEFLHGLYSFAATNLDELSPADAAALDAATVAYYQAIDPANERLTLDGFKTKNGFNIAAPAGFQLCGGNVCDNPDVEVNVAFANSGDLGFGRDMHCRRSDPAGGSNSDYACYVTNYGDITTDDNVDALGARTNGTSGSPLIATVAMEFSRILPTDPASDRHVKFYVYNAAGNRINNADLDSGANIRKRPVPQLCMVCHGGAYPPPSPGTGVPSFGTPDSAKLGSKFLPFDVRFYTFPAAPVDKAAQQAAMKKLNQDIVKFAPGSTAINEVIDGMYAGGVTTQKEEFVIPGWDKAQQPKTVAQEHFYKRVVGNACRTCHIAQTFSTLQFREAESFTKDQLSSAENRVCNELVMPHAKRTSDIFWGQFWSNDFGNISPTIVAQFQVYGDTLKKNTPQPAGWVGTWPPAWNGTLCGDFTPGVAASPPSYYSTLVHPLWSRNYNGGSCVGCHSAVYSDPDTAVVAANLVASGRIVPNNEGASTLLSKVLGTAAGARMPYNCSDANPTPSGSLRCLHEGAGYNAATDTIPATDTHEVNRIKHWINTGATP